MHGERGGMSWAGPVDDAGTMTTRLRELVRSVVVGVLVLAVVVGSGALLVDTLMAR